MTMDLPRTFDEEQRKQSSYQPVLHLGKRISYVIKRLRNHKERGNLSS